MAIFLKYDDGKLKGSATEEGHKEQIEFDSMNFGVSRMVSMSGKNRETDTPNLTEITLSKMMDKASTGLMLEACASDGVECIIHCTKSAAQKDSNHDVFLEITLTNALVSGYSVSYSPGGPPMENISLSYTKILIEYKERDAKGIVAEGTPFTYDIETGKVG